MRLNGDHVANEANTAAIGKKTWFVIAIIFIGSIALAGVFVVLGPEEIVRRLEAVSGWTQRYLIVSFLIFLVWAFVSQLFIAPTGALTLLIGGYLLGWPAGMAYAAMTLVSGVIVFDNVRRDGAGGALPAGLKSFKLDRLSDAARQEGLGLVASMRVIPFFPPPLVAMASRVLEINRRDFLIGTLATAWIVPVIVAAVGGTMSSLLDATDPGDLMSGGVSVAILVIALLVSVVAAFRVFRRLQAPAEEAPHGS